MQLNYVEREKMQQVKLVWATPDSDNILAYIARVSNPQHQDKPVGTLFNYMMREGHTSPFTMANMCLEMNSTRDIVRQVLRHWSFDFQEFSQRYQTVEELGLFQKREARLQDEKNRQNSLPCDDLDLADWWDESQNTVIELVDALYKEALKKGIAKEQARALLPEGLTPSRVYINGNFRTWIFYLKSRLHETTQKEHREVAKLCLDIFYDVAPITAKAFFG